MKAKDFDLVILESKILRENFSPISLTRPLFEFLLGSSTIAERIKDALHKKIDHAFVPKYLEKVTKESHPEIKINECPKNNVLVVNPLVSPALDLAKEIQVLNADSEESVLIDEQSGILALGLFNYLSARSIEDISFPSGRKRNLKKRIVPGALFKHPWEFYELNSKAIESDYINLIKNNGRNVGEKLNCEVLGERLFVADDVESSTNVSIDTRNGPVIISEGAEIESFSLIQGPVFIGKDTVVKSARIREGTSIGKDCRASGEIEKSVIFDCTNKAHEGFLGHSIIGSWVNFGALTTNSDLKNTYGEIRAGLGNNPIRTNSNKVGIVIGDMTKTAIGTMIYSGKTVGVSSHLFGTVTEDVPSFSMYGKSLGSRSSEMYLESALETQQRMMARRNKTMTPAHREVIRSIFEMTKSDRRRAHVGRQRFRISN